jgi:DNA invertase Pin-like site-specific DNA recombinase
MTPCALYLRVSDDRLELDNQRTPLEAMAAARGLSIVDVHEDTLSGSKPTRPGLEALMRGAHEGRYHYVLVWALDRLGRSMRATIDTVLELDRLGCRVVSHQEPWLDTAGPVRELLLAIFAWVAEQERARLIERTRAGQARARAEGKTIGRPVVAVDMPRARALRAQGASYRTISATLGISRSTVHKALRS